MSDVIEQAARAIYEDEKPLIEGFDDYDTLPNYMKLTYQGKTRAAIQALIDADWPIFNKLIVEGYDDLDSSEKADAMIIAKAMLKQILQENEDE